MYFFTILNQLQIHDRTSQHVTRVCEFHVYFIVYLKTPIVGHTNKQFHTFQTILFAVNGFYG